MRLQIGAHHCLGAACASIVQQYVDGEIGTLAVERQRFEGQVTTQLVAVAEGVGNALRRAIYAYLCSIQLVGLYTLRPRGAGKMKNPQWWVIERRSGRPCSMTT